MAPDKCCYLIFSGNSSKIQDLVLNLLGKKIPYCDCPIFLAYVLTQVEFIRSRCQNRLNIIKILSHKSWKLNDNTLSQKQISRGYKYSRIPQK
ncbi:hypothetical protein BpHYR1_000711 [Brachionus plicatilis]|uniref:Uncharacterized protein n=1 Tax=Brachionus plicatilis TaxID=10195 RepID=A0A3M7SBV3_BRAPC|nr:hypothetical protein BpHYR1_000711 [Brachionus plicatilis]